ncbi:Vacuolar protein sorting-associated protein 45 [Hondaea fermentalgiana]|uniref:Vacuolar protein sorting-associated protein 45 n=1 Tax=Hondaea fermentalgiana TaxID=2315210 RepID=A0A2R5GQ98_9STRA|nr:Vacuolar protein sorting-associated protein 45 [Hondaea fermentalgiana]|eukprot:GBG30531.1 Vacuolar protein sorting-associated protein 45 [Hondaea fermentalgiana]
MASGSMTAGGPKETGFSHLQRENQGMNPATACEGYFDKILSSISGMKVLLLDWETTGILSMVMSQTKVLEREVFLATNLTESREAMMHLKAVVYCRPTRSNVQALRQELREPKYGEYHIFFSNIVRQDLLQQLADADEREVVKQVQEVFADFYAVNNELFTLNIANSLLHSVPRTRWSRDEEGSYYRTVEGVLASLLAFKKRPAIRFQRSSDLCHNFAREIKHQMEREQQLFDFRDGQSSLLLIVDRRDDPVTPLLTQWTYQAMVHELLGIRNNRVSLAKAPGISADMEEVVLALSDQFFESHMYTNFGDLAEAVAELLQNYQRQQKTNQQIESIEDMQRFVESYPQFKQFATNVSKHVAVVGELVRLVNSHKLMEVSQLEQELACTSDHATQIEEVKAKILSPSTSRPDALRLVLLYAIRYENHPGNAIGQLKRMLREKGVEEVRIQLVDQILAYGGASKRGSDLFGESTLLSKSLKLATRAIKGVSNVYTQHNPLLAETLDKLAKGKLSEKVFAFAGSGNAREKPRDVIVFILGGATFEEAAAVHRFNVANPGMRVVIGGSSVHSSNTFLSELARLGSGGLPVSSFQSRND